MDRNTDRCGASFCEYCGAMIPEGCNFCENCGAPVPEEEEYRPAGAGKWALLAAAAVIIVVAGCLGGFAFGQTQTAKNIEKQVPIHKFVDELRLGDSDGESLDLISKEPKKERAYMGNPRFRHGPEAGAPKRPPQKLVGPVGRHDRPKKPNSPSKPDPNDKDDDRGKPGDINIVVINNPEKDDPDVDDGTADEEIGTGQNDDTEKDDADTNDDEKNGADKDTDTEDVNSDDEDSERASDDTESKDEDSTDSKSDGDKNRDKDSEKDSDKDGDKEKEKETPEKKSEKEIYAPVLKDIAKACDDGNSKAANLPKDLREYIEDCDEDGDEAEAYYAMEDLDKNGKKELIIGICIETEDGDDETCPAGVYTVKDEKAHLFSELSGIEKITRDGAIHTESKTYKIENGHELKSVSGSSGSGTWNFDWSEI